MGERVMTQEESIEYLLRRSQRQGDTFPIRREFIQARVEGRLGEPTTGPGPLSDLLRAPHALELLLLVYAVTTSGDFGVTERSQLWGRAAGIYMLADQKASVAVSRQWQHLEKLGLIERRQHGRFKRIIKRRECGLVGESSVPYTAPAGAKGDVYFRVPFAYWRKGWHQKLDMPGKAVLLAAMSRRRETFTLPQDTRGARALGLSRHTVTRGIDELLSRKLLVKTGTDEVVNVRIKRGYEWVNTYQLAEPFNINLSNSESERLKAERTEIERTEEERLEAKYQTLKVVQLTAEEVKQLALGGNARRKARGGGRLRHPGGPGQASPRQPG
ncbi:hypothetical protein OG582_40245 (plasmid) [Streptomyces anulatus]|uniref:hypothetical protein n=1 Tax=Streptomyces anulatus TaxID=1892 RepID=UPI002F908C7B|nr:hypothetical protein OHA54_00025 [Streptomyces anulatus]WTD14827.1 hypothetical protein OHA54_38765 [Streptomyces anulatus]WTE00998.1 hypothetical protein OH765_00025 [Streptomyces anulatus]WTE08137.1 hypothetical protein OH765_38870 [Streptomyces anulatus]